MKSILSVMQKAGVQLIPRGSLYVALCPLHNDKDSPSLTVYSRSNTWCCFGNCGIKDGYNGGDAIEFIRQRFNFTFQQAKDWLGEVDDSKEIIPQFVKPKHRIVPDKMVIYWHNLMNANNKKKWFYGRGFTDEIIDRELWGWDGSKYCIPVWEEEPGNSRCLGVRKRSVSGEGPKYIGLSGMNRPTVWGRWYCLNHKKAICFAGELDAARAIQDGYPSFSLVNGVNAISQFPNNWPNNWFPDTEKLVVLFDKNEEVQAGQLAHAWNVKKGSMQAKIMHWPLDIIPTDYCEYRDSFTLDEFNQLISKMWENDI